MRPHHLVLITILSTLSSQALALRCGNQLVTEGMSRHEVRKRCGNPDDSDRRFETIYRQTAHHESVAIEIEIEEWYYDFGSNSFDRRLIFVNGRLQSEEIVH